MSMDGILRRARGGRPMTLRRHLPTAAFLAVLAMSCSGPLWPDEKPRGLPILQRWSGDYPAAQIDRLPEGQRQTRAGYLGDAETFGRVWQALKPGTFVPVVDLSAHIVVFARNLDFYNRNMISKVVLWHGAAEVVAVETPKVLVVLDLFLCSHGSLLIEISVDGLSVAFSSPLIVGAL